MNPKSKIQNPKSKIQNPKSGLIPFILAAERHRCSRRAKSKKFSIPFGKNFPLRKMSEITMEMNPATVTLETLKNYQSLGINRASFGLQTFDDTELKRLGRRHTARDARETFELLRRAGFKTSRSI